MTYRDTLSEKDAHLARRLEGFGDVVFGFSVSQLALQLSLPQTPQDLVGNPIRYFLYFATFAALAGFWLRFHRMLSGAFRPAPFELVAVFFYLAFVGLVPYALYANAHFAMNGSLQGGRAGLAAYLLCITMLSLSSAGVQLRNFVRGYTMFDERERRKAWESSTVSVAVTVTTAFALIVDLTAGVSAGGFAAFAIAAGAAITRQVARRRIPSAALLRLPADTNRIPDGEAGANRIRDGEADTNPAEAPAG